MHLAEYGRVRFSAGVLASSKVVELFFEVTGLQVRDLLLAGSKYLIPIDPLIEGRGRRLHT